MNDLLILAADNGGMAWLFTGPMWGTLIAGYIVGKFDLIATAMNAVKKNSAK